MDCDNARAFMERAIDLARRRGALAAECDCFFSLGRSFSVRDDEVENRSFSRVSGIGLRVLDAKSRQGTAALSEFDGDVAGELCDGAFGSASHAAVENDVLFAQNTPPPQDFGIEVYDAGMADWPSDTQIELCLEMSAQARRLDKRVRCVNSACSGVVTERSMTLNTYGVFYDRVSSLGYLGVTVLARDGDSAEIGGASRDARSVECLLAGSPVREAVRGAVELLHGAPIPSGRYTLVLKPEVTAEFMYAIASLFSAVAVSKGLSVFAGRMGERAASEALTLTDDGRLPGGLGTAVCDGELVETRRTTLIDRGRVNSWLCNLQYGKRLGLASTGNGSKGLASIPDVDVTNLFPLPGKRGADEILAARGRCFVVSELMGLHTIDTVGGDFSLAARGQYLKDGVFKPVSSVTIAGNLADFLKNIAEVGSDLRFFGQVGGCTMVVDDIAVAGA